MKCIFRRHGFSSLCQWCYFIPSYYEIKRDIFWTSILNRKCIMCSLISREHMVMRSSCNIWTDSYIAGTKDKWNKMLKMNWVNSAQLRFHHIPANESYWDVPPVLFEYITSCDLPYCCAQHSLSHILNQIPTLAPLLAELGYLCMIFILWLIFTASSLKNDQHTQIN